MSSADRPPSRAYWCTRGGLFTLVHASDPETAADKAARAMRRPSERVSVRRATASERALWAVLLEQDLAGAEGLREDFEPEVQGALFAA